MKALLKSNAIRVLLLLNLVVATLYLGRWGLNAYGKWREGAERVERHAAKREKDGEMMGATSRDFDRLQDKADAEHRLSDGELARVVEMGNLPALNPRFKTSLNPILALSTLSQLRDFNAGERRIVAPFLRQCMATRPEVGSDGIAEWASDLVRKHRMLDLVPDLERLAQSDRPSAPYVNDNLQRLRAILMTGRDPGAKVRAGG